MIKYFFEKLFCCIGLHDWRRRTNNGQHERVCMRTCCDKREKLYKAKKGNIELWNRKKIPVRKSSFKPKVKK